MIKKLLILAILSITSLSANYPIILEDKCIQITEEEIEYDASKRYHRACYAATLSEDSNDLYPQRLDSITTLISAVPMVDVIVYTYRVAVPKRLKNKIKAIAIALEKQNIESNCGNKEIKDYIFELGLSVVHAYYQKDGTLITSFKIDKDTCDKLETN